jgi:hypothetical protein
MGLKLFSNDDRKQRPSAAVLAPKICLLVAVGLLGWLFFSTAENCGYVRYINGLVGQPRLLYTWQNLGLSILFAALGVAGLVLLYMTKKWADELWDCLTDERIPAPTKKSMARR